MPSLFAVSVRISSFVRTLFGVVEAGVLEDLEAVVVAAELKSLVALSNSPLAFPSARANSGILEGPQSTMTTTMTPMIIHSQPEKAR